MNTSGIGQGPQIDPRTALNFAVAKKGFDQARTNGRNIVSMIQAAGETGKAAAQSANAANGRLDRFA